MKFLFLCTGNSCRSILSEALFNEAAPAGWQAFSAGSHPSGQVHPFTIKTLSALGIDSTPFSSKTIAACEQYAPDVVITVCSNAANEACPAYLGSAIKAHWGLEDPSHLNCDDEQKMAAFMQTVAHIKRRLTVLFDQAPSLSSRDELAQLMQNIGSIQ